MKLLPALILLAVAAACSERDRSSSVEAARADSSAAGYAVGRRADSTRPDSARADTATRVASTSGTPPNDSTTRVPTTRARTDSGATGGIRTGTATAGHASAAGSSTTPSKDSSSHAAAQHAVRPNVAATKPAPDSAAPAPTGPVRVNEFLTYDARSRTVSLQLIAGYNGLNGSLNYNGATSGSHGLIVPVGWRIHVAVTNRDSDLQHSAIVVPKVLPPPIEPTEPAFAGAALPQLDEGLQEDETGTIDFVATHAGRFMIACGVPGHAQAGEWLELVVTKSAGPPSYR